MSAKIEYNGEVIAYLGAGEKITLLCGGKRLTDNIVITNGDDSAIPTEVMAEDEMTAILETATVDSVGAVYQYTGETTDTYENGALYIIQEVE